jgi:anti-sigma factor RsiW
MNATTHSFSPEEIMAYFDRELSAPEAAQVETHLEECAECRALASGFRATSHALDDWKIEPAQTSIAEAVEQRHIPLKKLDHRTSRKAAHRPFWTSPKFGGAVAFCGLLLVGLFVRQNLLRKPDASYGVAVSKMTQPSAERASIADYSGYSATAGALKAGNQNAFSSAASMRTPAAPPIKDKAVGATDALETTSTGPLIARSAALTLQVKDCVGARSALDAILARHHGYAASITLSTPAGMQASFLASLRIPVSELAAAMAEIRSMGRVLQETQSGEEVTQQHVDLVARLHNARETEDRLRELLATRTGKIGDLLQVEQAMNETRGQIESMEADLQQLDHRVEFAAVELDCGEPYREQLSSPQSASAGAQITNALISGLRNAGTTLLGLVLFVGEFGPSILIWIVLLGLPAFLLVRRYRRLRSRL